MYEITIPIKILNEMRKETNEAKYLGLKIQNNLKGRNK